MILKDKMNLLKELRIGSWVYWRDIIVPISITDLLMLTRYTESVHYKPIPLSPTILEKNRFSCINNDKRTYGINEFSNAQNYLNITIYLEHPETCFVEHCVNGIRSYYKGTIAYVHQLQNSYQMCNIKKEIEV